MRRALPRVACERRGAARGGRSATRGRRDAELNGVHSADAHADDGSGVDDEDGVVFGEIQVGQSDAIATVMVQGAGIGARLDAWIDFNDDGSWDGAGEQVATSRGVVNGSNSITFEVPANVAPGLTYARFRLSTAGSLAPFGAAADGEVEDYQVRLDPPSPTKMRFGVAELLSEHRADDLQAHDLDRDGDLDLVSVSILNRTIQWYENVGATSFEPRTIHHFETYVLDGPNSLDVADLDGDGDLDLLTAGHEPFTLGWLENDGQQNFSLHTIVEPGTYGHLARAGDVDGDGDLDVVAVVGQELRWFENEGNEEFIGHAVGAANFYSSRALELVDMDRDGDLDFQIDDAEGVAWYANDHGEFERQSVWVTNLYIVDAKVGDLDGDGDLDVVSTAGGKVRVHLNRHSGGLAGFDRFELQAFGDSSATLDLADLDGDGDQDIAAERVWFRNVGNGQFDYAQTLVQHVEIFQLLPADLDGDGDLDLVANESGREAIRWFENADYFVELWTESQEPVLEHSTEQRRFRFYRREDVSEPLDVTIRIGGMAQLGVDYTLSGVTMLGGGLAGCNFRPMRASSTSLSLPSTTRSSNLLKRLKCRWSSSLITSTTICECSDDRRQRSRRLGRRAGAVSNVAVAGRGCATAPWGQGWDRRGMPRRTVSRLRMPAGMMKSAIPTAALFSRRCASGSRMRRSQCRSETRRLAHGSMPGSTSTATAIGEGWASRYSTVCSWWAGRKCSASMCRAISMATATWTSSWPATRRSWPSKVQVILAGKRRWGSFAARGSPIFMAACQGFRWSILTETETSTSSATTLRCGS